jgi:hypothetical protein
MSANFCFVLSCVGTYVAMGRSVQGILLKCLNEFIVSVVNS